MQIGQLGLQPLVVNRGARDVARATRACPGRRQRLVHGSQNLRMLAHAEIVIATPDHDLARVAVGMMPRRLGELATLPLHINELAIATFVVQVLQGTIQGGFVGHRVVSKGQGYHKCRACARLDLHQIAGK